jgi:hypothetical protein
MPLIDKLKQDLSVKSVKAVLMHDLTGNHELIDTGEIEIQVEDD